MISHFSVSKVIVESGIVKEETCNTMCQIKSSMCVNRASTIMNRENAALIFNCYIEFARGGNITKIRDCSLQLNISLPLFCGNWLVDDEISGVILNVPNAIKSMH